MELLLVMCPQNSFFDPKGSVYMGEKAEALKVRLDDYLSSYPGKKIFFREKHAEADDFFSNDKTHSIVNSFDFQVLDSFKKYADIFYDKEQPEGSYQLYVKNLKYNYEFNDVQNRPADVGNFMRDNPNLKKLINETIIPEAEKAYKDKAYYKNKMIKPPVSAPATTSK